MFVLGSDGFSRAAALALRGNSKWPDARLSVMHNSWAEPDAYGRKLGSVRPPGKTQILTALPCSYLMTSGQQKAGICYAALRRFTSAKGRKVEKAQAWIGETFCLFGRRGPLGMVYACVGRRRSRSATQSRILRLRGKVCQGQTHGLDKVSELCGFYRGPFVLSNFRFWSRKLGSLLTGKPATPCVLWPTRPCGSMPDSLPEATKEQVAADAWTASLGPERKLDLRPRTMGQRPACSPVQVLSDFPRRTGRCARQITRNSTGARRLATVFPAPSSMLIPEHKFMLSSLSEEDCKASTSGCCSCRCQV